MSSSMENIPQLLPHEAHLLESALNSLKEEQNKLGKLMGEAMTQASETYHDNAPAEVIASESTILYARARPLLDMLKNYVVIKYPADEPIEKVILGSKVVVEIDDRVDEIFIVGSSILYDRQLLKSIQHLTRINSSNPESAIFVSIDAPLAKTLLGKKSGESVRLIVEDKVTNIRIHSTEQGFLPVEEN